MKKLLATILTAILTVGACFSFVGCNDEKKPSEIGIGDGKLVIGYTIYPPMNYEEDGKFVGFDTDLAIAVCDYLKVDYEFKEIVWKNKVMSLNSKEIDVVWNGMTITEELQDAMSITKSYLQNQQVIVCKKADADKFSESADKKGLAGFEVFVETGSAGESTAKELSITPTGVAAQKDTLLNVKTGAKSVAIIDKLMADVLVGEGSANPDLTYVNVNFPVEYFGIGCRKNDIVTTVAIEVAINELVENGTFATLQAKYFG